MAMEAPQENPNIVYGRLLESVHISGYSIHRVCSELEWLMDENRWMQVGPGYKDFNDFVRTVDVSQFRIDQDHRKSLAARMKELGASQRPIAQALGVGKATITRDLSGPNGPADLSATYEDQLNSGESGPNGPPAPTPKAWFQEPDGKVVQQAITGVRRQVKEQERKSRRDTNAHLPLNDLACQLYCSDFELIADTLGEFDSIITDIPYDESGLECSRQLREWAPVLLKLDGLLAVMCGQFRMFEVLEIINQTMQYRWTLCYPTPGGQSPQIWPAKVNTFWKPILLFQNSSEPPGHWIGDVVKCEINDNDKRFHEWGQSEAGFAQIIEKLTMPGDHVLDPFMGAGTTGVAALSRGRHFTGVDVDAVAVETASRRIGSRKSSGC